MSELVKSESTLTRNGETVPLYIGEFGKLSKENKGLKFPYPILDEATFDRDVKMIGKDFVATKMTKILRQIFGAIQVACWDKDKGEVDTEEWLERAQDFTEGEEKRDDLQDKKNILTDRFALITEGDAFLQNQTPEMMNELKEIGEQVTIINEQLKRIQQDIDAKTAKRNATKAKNAEALAKRQAELQAKKKMIAHYAETHKVSIEAATEHFAKLEEAKSETTLV